MLLAQSPKQHLPFISVKHSPFCQKMHPMVSMTGWPLPIQSTTIHIKLPCPQHPQWNWPAALGKITNTHHCLQSPDFFAWDKTAAAVRISAKADSFLWVPLQHESIVKGLPSKGSLWTGPANILLRKTETQGIVEYYYMRIENAFFFKYTSSEPTVFHPRITLWSFEGCAHTDWSDKDNCLT